MINKNKLGVVIGSFWGFWHLAWSIFVALGFAQQLINFVFRLHFIQPPYTVMPFNLGFAVALIAITSSLGYMIGWVLAAIWNWLHATRERVSPMSVVEAK